MSRGYFAARGEDAVFDRRTPLRMVFCEPQIALVGATWDTLQDRRDEIATGQASFDEAGRTMLQRGQGGAIRIYAEKSSARILGAAIAAPEAEHLAHLLAHAIGQGKDLRDLLRMPAYHPTHEEVLRPRDAGGAGGVRARRARTGWRSVVRIRLLTATRSGPDPARPGGTPGPSGRLRFPPSP